MVLEELEGLVSTVVKRRAHCRIARDAVERKSKLAEFIETCERWYKYRDTHCACARVRVYARLKERWGAPAVLRHAEMIKEVLDRAEKEYRKR